MAQMFPRTLMEDGSTSPGEVAVFRALRDGLDDDWEVFHSVGLVVRDRATGARDGELDFVLAHPEHGVLCLEVKGGDIECRHGEWLRRIDGAMERVKSPFAQVVGHKHTLRGTLASRDGWPAAGLIVHAVVLPDVSVHSLVLGADAPPELVIDRHRLADVAAAVGEVLAWHCGSRDTRVAPGAAGVAALRDLVAPTVEIRSSLAAAFAEEERVLVELTREQALALDRLGRNPRVALYGCAGSGKTMLAVEHARRLCEAGKDVLFVCFNRRLAAHVATSERHDRLTVSTFHRLCVRTAASAKVAVPSYPEDATPQRFWDDELPEAFADAVGELGPQWDALVVDEAQDLHDHWLDALRMGLRDERAAPVWLFLDDNQRVYEPRLTVPDDFFKWELTTNCRTTQAIHRELLKLYDGETAPDVRGPAGRAPELHLVRDQPAKVGALLRRLRERDEVPSEDIVVLSPHGAAGSDVYASLAGQLWEDKPPARGSAVRFSSIRGFKGLESPVVVLCELDDIDQATRDQQLYVGMSRAKNHCVIVAPG